VVGCDQIYSRLKNDISAAVTSDDTSSEENLIIESVSTHDHSQRQTQHQSSRIQGEMTNLAAGQKDTFVKIDLNESSLVPNNERGSIPSAKDIKKILIVPKNSADHTERQDMHMKNRAEKVLPRVIDGDERTLRFAKTLEQKDVSGFNKDRSESIKRATASVVVFEKSDLTVNFSNEMPSILSPKFSSIELFQQIDGK
jgi:hypothetical protein